MKPDRLHMCEYNQTKVPIHPIHRQSAVVCLPFERTDHCCTTVITQNMAFWDFSPNASFSFALRFSAQNTATKLWNLRHVQCNDAISRSGRNKIMWAKGFNQLWATPFSSLPAGSSATLNKTRVLIRLVSRISKPVTEMSSDKPLAE